jgi:hypothetical protein
MNAEQLFTRPPSPVPGQPPSILHRASCIVHGPSSIVRSQPSNLPLFHFSPFQNCKEFLEIGGCAFHTKCFINVREIAHPPGSDGFCCQTTLIIKQPGGLGDRDLSITAINEGRVVIMNAKWLFSFALTSLVRSCRILICLPL